MNDQTKGALSGIRVVEMGQLIAGPFAGSLLAYFGAEVIKIEAPNQGDPLRDWRVRDSNGTSYWWRAMARNKKCITLNLREENARKLARKLIDGADVLIENFRPGTLEKWQMAPETLKETNPGLVLARISGYGQTGPYANRPGFASVCEGIGGFRYINGFPGEAPVRPNLSLGDTLAALNAVIGVLLALLARGQPHREGLGQVVDVAIYEAVFNVLESVVPEFDGAGVVREPSGSTLTGIVPTNTYVCRDDKYVIIGGNGDSIYKRLMRATGRDDLADDPRLTDNPGRVKHQTEIDDAITEWTRTLDAQDVLRALEEAQVPSGPIYNVRDMMSDPHFQARALFEDVNVAGETLKIPAISPKLNDTPGRTQWPGPELGAHNEEIFMELLGLKAEELSALKAKGLV